MNVRHVAALTIGLALVVAAVVYLQWWQSGELGVLNRRVNELDELARRRESRKPATSTRRRAPKKTTEGEGT